MSKKLRIGAVCGKPYIQRTTELIKGMIAQAFGSGCDIVVFSALSENDREVFRLILSEKFDGFIFDKSSFDDVSLCLYAEKMLKKSGRPVMMTDSSEHNLFENTAANDKRPFEKLIDHLIEVHGCSNLLCIAGDRNDIHAVQRANGFADSLKKHSFSPESGRCIMSDGRDTILSTVNDIKKHKMPKPDAVICGDIDSAEMVMELLLRSGFRIPCDIIVAGFESTSSHSGYITSGKRNYRQLGADSVSRLYRAITGSVTSRVYFGESELHIGLSCGCSPLDFSTTLSRRGEKVSAEMDKKLLDCSIASAGKLSDLRTALVKISSYSRYIHNFSSMSICITEDFFNSGNEKHISCDTPMVRIVKTHSSGAAICDEHQFKGSEILPELSETRKKTMAVFVNVLANEVRTYGFSVLSFGKKDDVFSEAYRYYLLSISRLIGQFENDTFSGAERKGNLINTDIAKKKNESPLFFKMKSVREAMAAEPQLEWNLDAVSRELGISKSYLQKYHKEKFGGSLIEYLIVIRIEKAKKLLAETALSVTAIAEKCGYSSYIHFAKQFRKRTGTTPTQYREIR